MLQNKAFDQFPVTPPREGGFPAASSGVYPLAGRPGAGLDMLDWNLSSPRVSVPEDGQLENCGSGINLSTFCLPPHIPVLCQKKSLFGQNS